MNMSKNTTVYMVAGLVSAILVSTAIGLTTFDKSVSQYLKTSTIGSQAPQCGNARSKFNTDEFEPSGSSSGYGSSRLDAIRKAQANMLSQTHLAWIKKEAMARLLCGRGCMGNTGTCSILGGLNNIVWDCEADKKLDNRWRAECNVEVICTKTCTKRPLLGSKPAVGITIEDSQVDEGDEVTVLFHTKGSFRQEDVGDLDIDISVVDKTTTKDWDYIEPSLHYSISDNPGYTQKNIEIQIIDDDEKENLETFFVAIDKVESSLGIPIEIDPQYDKVPISINASDQVSAPQPSETPEEPDNTNDEPEE